MSSGVPGVLGSLSGKAEGQSDYIHSRYQIQVLLVMVDLAAMHRHMMNLFCMFVEHMHLNNMLVEKHVVLMMPEPGWQQKILV